MYPIYTQCITLHLPYIFPTSNPISTLYLPCPQVMYVPTDHNALNVEDEEESGFLCLAHAAIGGGISGVFDKFLGSYVLLERQNLEDMLQRLAQVTPTLGVNPTL